MSKVIIESAVNGYTIPTQSPYLPITADDIVNQIVESYKAGAAIARFHIREIEKNVPAVSTSVFQEIMKRVREQCNIILCPFADVYGINNKSSDIIVDCSPEMTSFKLGPNITPDFRLLKEYSEFKYPWEREYLEQSFHKCEHFSYEVMETFGRAITKNKILPELEIHDTGELDNIVWMLEEEIIKRPLYLQFILNAEMHQSTDYIIHLYTTAKEKLGEFNFTVSTVGEKQMIMGSVCLALGGHIRVGLGDSAKNSKGEMIKSSTEQILAAAEIIEGMGYEVTTPDEARIILGINA